MLAAGYKTAEAMAAEIEEVRSVVGNFGVNVFVPEAEASDPAGLAAYARALAPLAAELGVAPPRPAGFSDDHYAAKLDHLVAHPVPVVSFTFGLPCAEDIARLRAAGSAVVLNATDAAEVRAADALQPDAITVQGFEAGGHRATHSQAKSPAETGTARLVAQARAITGRHLSAAGGIADPDTARLMLAAGADTVQVGTLFLTTEEAGTKEAHREALLGGEYRDTVSTRAFSGRAARALRNRFTERMSAHQVVGYPQVHYMTAPLRAASAASAADAGGLNLWAGTGFAACRRVSAREVVELFRDL